MLFILCSSLVNFNFMNILQYVYLFSKLASKQMLFRYIQKINFTVVINGHQHFNDFRKSLIV